MANLFLAPHCVAAVSSHYFIYYVESIIALHSANSASNELAAENSTYRYRFLLCKIPLLGIPLKVILVSLFFPFFFSSLLILFFFSRSRYYDFLHFSPLFFLFILKMIFDW